jgi:hypothetical protein
MAFGNMMEQKLHTIQFKQTLKTLRYSVFTRTTMATFGLGHTKTVRINLTERHLKSLNHIDERRTADNSGLAKGGVWCFDESLVLNPNFVHLMKFGAEKPALHQAAKR